MDAPKPSHEEQRLAALRRLQVLDTPPEARFDRITRSAAQLLNTPTALISLVDSERQWFRSTYGLDATETPRSVSFCAHAILKDETLVVRDAACDARFADNPLVAGPPHVRFYAGVPIKTLDDYPVGTMCIIGHEPRELDARERQVLQLHAAWAESELNSVEARKAFAQVIRDAQEREMVEQLKTDFLSAAAHELRSPMASVYGFAELLLQRSFEPIKQRELLQIIYDQSAQMTRLINELLDLARIEARAGRAFEMREAQIEWVVNAAVAGFLVPPGREPPRVLAAANLPAVRLDADKIQQALTNVISNAYKYSPQGGAVSIDIDLDPGRREVLVEVTDHGIGMAPAVSARVFERFFRADECGAIRGTGLGMTLVKEITEHHGGSVSITSAPGNGTRVTLRLPLDGR